jgi:hypothetical protein
LHLNHSRRRSLRLRLSLAQRTALERGHKARARPRDVHARDRANARVQRSSDAREDRGVSLNVRDDRQRRRPNQSISARANVDRIERRTSRFDVQI